MRQDTIRNSRRAYLAWSAILLALLGAGIAGNFVLDWRVARWRDLDPRFHLVAAERLLADKHYAAARGELDDALRLAPHLPEPYVLRGHLCYELKQWDAAKADYEKAIACGSTNRYLPGRIFWCLMNMERYDEAAVFGREALAKGPGTPALRRDVAEAYLRAGKPAEAAPLFEAAVQEAPQDVELMERLAAAYQAGGRPADAEAVRKRINETRAAATDR